MLNQMNWVLEALRERRFIVIHECRELEKDWMSSTKGSWDEGDPWMITEIYIAPLQGYYSGALPILAQLKRTVFRLE